MIAADTSTWIAYLGRGTGADVVILDQALADRFVLMPPAVLAELLSDPKLDAQVAAALLEVPLIATGDGYWERAGRLRARVLSKRRKARLGHALIAQSCIDRGIPLLTRDKDFKAFESAAGLNLCAS